MDPPAQPTMASRRGSHPAPAPQPQGFVPNCNFNQQPLPMLCGGDANWSTENLPEALAAAGLRAAPPPQQQLLQFQQQQLMQHMLSAQFNLGGRLPHHPGATAAAVTHNAPASVATAPATTVAPSASTARGATSVTASYSGARSLPRVVITSPRRHPKSTSKRPTKKGGAAAKDAKAKSHKRNRNHAVPTSIVLPHSSSILPPHPVPEFLCHLYSMLSDASYTTIITWVVPTENEGADQGGGRMGTGKVVVHDPLRLQDEVLGRYYRHSRYSSFQRQLNYFGFKKRLHGQRKGKMCPCSFVHDALGPDPQSLLRLKRRLPSQKAKGSDASSTDGSRSTVPGQAGRKRKPPKDPNGVLGPSTISMSSVSTASPQRSSPLQNDAWVQNVPPIAALNLHPLAMSLMSSLAQGPSDPGIAAASAWPAPAGGVPLPPVATTSHPQQPERDNAAAMRASNDAAVREARRSLAENFLKSQMERPGEMVSSVLGPVPSAMPGSSIPMGNALPQQQSIPEGNGMQQPSMPGGYFLPQQLMLGNAMIPQQTMMAPNLAGPVSTKVDNPFSSTLPMQPSVQAASALEGQNWAGYGPNSTLVVTAPTFPSDANAAALPNGLLSSLFPNKAFDASAGASAALLPSKARNFSLAHSDSMGSDRIMQMLGTSESHPQGVDESPPVQYSDLFSNLLNTALPPSEELFDDDMSAGTSALFLGGICGCFRSDRWE